MEDLELKIAHWRRELPASLTSRPDVIDELESHLRDELARLIAEGMSLDEAWPVAVQRLGSANSLAAEFAKVPPARWLPGTVAVAILLVAGVGIGGLVTWRVWDGGMGLLLASHVFAVVVGYLAALFTGALAVWAVAERLCRGELREGAAFCRAAGGLSRVSLALTALGVVLGAVWASGQLGRVWGWDAREVGGLGVLLCTALSAVALRHSARAGMAAAIAGSIATVLAWFGPWLLEITRGAGAGVALAVVLGAVVAIQVVTMVLVLVPAGGPEATGRA